MCSRKRARKMVIRRVNPIMEKQPQARNEKIEWRMMGEAKGAD